MSAAVMWLRSISTVVHAHDAVAGGEGEADEHADQEGQRRHSRPISERGNQHTSAALVLSALGVGALVARSA
jgi:hypothetical protein